jgi:hypothetical protein
MSTNETYHTPDIDLTIFMCTDPSVNGYKSLIDQIRSTGLVTFGTDNALNLTRVLGSGDFAVTFSGYYTKNPQAKFAFKVMKGDIGRQGEEGVFTEAMREYKIMSSVKCLGPQGPIVCTEGACIFAMGKFLAFVIVLEEMDDTLVAYLPTLDKKPDLKEAICLKLLLKTLSATRTLHAMQIYHMDSYPRNWLVKWKSHPTDPDIRLSDFGRACYVDEQQQYSCVSLRLLDEDDYYFFNFPHLIEYIHYMPTILGLLDALPKNEWQLSTLRSIEKQITTLNDAYINSDLPEIFTDLDRLKTITFEDWFAPTQNLINSLLARGSPTQKLDESVTAREVQQILGQVETDEEPPLTWVKNARYEQRQGYEVIIIPAQTTLYHGDILRYPDEGILPRTRFFSNLDVALYYAFRNDQMGQVISVVTTRDVILFDVTSKKNFAQLRDKYQVQSPEDFVRGKRLKFKTNRFSKNVTPVSKGETRYIVGDAGITDKIPLYNEDNKFMDVLKYGFMDGECRQSIMYADGLFSIWLCKNLGLDGWGTREGHKWCHSKVLWHPEIMLCQARQVLQRLPYDYVAIPHVYLKKNGTVVKNLGTVDQTPF